MFCSQDDQFALRCDESPKVCQSCLMAGVGQGQLQRRIHAIAVNVRARPCHSCFEGHQHHLVLVGVTRRRPAVPFSQAPFSQAIAGLLCSPFLWKVTL